MDRPPRVLRLPPSSSSCNFCASFSSSTYKKYNKEKLSMWFKETVQGDIYNICNWQSCTLITCWGESTSSEPESFFFSTYKQNKNTTNTKLSNNVTDNWWKKKSRSKLAIVQICCEELSLCKVSSYNWRSNITFFTSNNKPLFIQAVLIFSNLGWAQ